MSYDSLCKRLVTLVNLKRVVFHSAYANRFQREVVVCRVVEIVAGTGTRSMLLLLLCKTLARKSQSAFGNRTATVFTEQQRTRVEQRVRVPVQDKRNCLQVASGLFNRTSARQPRHCYNCSLPLSLCWKL